MYVPEAVPPEILNVMNLLNAYLQWKNANPAKKRMYDYFHPSSFGKCLRKAQYQRYRDTGQLQPHLDKMGIKLDVPLSAPNLIRIWDHGHSAGSRWVGYFEGLGIIRGCWRCRNSACNKVYGREEKIGCFKPEKCDCGSTSFEYEEVHVRAPELNFKGNCDIILDFSRLDLSFFKTGKSVPILFKPDDLPKKPIVVDMKTINNHGFKDKLAYGPSIEYRTQLVIYANILDLEYGVLIYENKDNSQTKVFKVDRNPQMWEKIKQQAILMNEMAPECRLPPPRPMSKDDTECSQCEFAPICLTSKVWDDPNLAEKRKSFYGDLQ